MKLRITNKTDNPQRVHTVNGTVTLDKGQPRDLDLADHEAKSANDNKAVFSVEGYVEPERQDEPLKAAPLDANGDTADMAALRKQFDAAWGDLTAEHDSLKKNLATVTKERDYLVARPAGIDPLDLPSAVRSLDDANDDHWTKAGEPAIARLKMLTGKDVERGEVIKVGRARATPAAK